MKDEIPTSNFEETLSRLEAERRLDPVISQSADYLVAASLLDEERDILRQVVTDLQAIDPRELYIKFLKDSVANLKSASSSQQYRYAKQISDVAIMGLGIWQEDLGLTAAGEQSLRIIGDPDWSRIEDHVSQTVFGEHYIDEYAVPDDSVIWGSMFPMRMSACDASQHRGKLRVPFNKTWATPVIVNNSAGVIKERHDGKSTWTNIAVPKDTRDYENWVIIGPNDYAELDEGDYEWAAKSAMDVGEFFVEETFIFRHGGASLKPDVHFRDGRIFPQDKLMNCRIENRHGQLTREAIYRMVSTVRTARELKVLYCGVAKQVELKVYSTIINWYISTVLGKTGWNPTNQIITDSEMMRNVLNCNGFSAKTFDKIYVACPILRRFETTSNLNRRTRRQARNDLDSLQKVYHGRDITAREIVDQALRINVIMFFAGHCPSDELYIPRYEFVAPTDPAKMDVGTHILKVLSALRLASFDVDEDHLWGLDDPVRTLVPTPILLAHDLSKRMGEELASNFSQRTLAEFIKRLREKKATLQ